MTLELSPLEQATRAWLPLPDADPRQTIETLSWEVGPPGLYAVRTTAAGERLLRVDAGAEGVPGVVVQALVALAPPSPQRPLPTALRDLLPRPQATDARRWVTAARARGQQARLAHGLEVSASEPGVVVWPEVLHDGEWQAVDLARRRLRLDRPRLRLGATAPQVEGPGGTRRPAPLRAAIRGASRPAVARHSSRLERRAPAGG